MIWKSIGIGENDEMQIGIDFTEWGFGIGVWPWGGREWGFIFRWIRIGPLEVRLLRSKYFKGRKQNG